MNVALCELDESVMLRSGALQAPKAGAQISTLVCLRQFTSSDRSGSCMYTMTAWIETARVVHVSREALDQLFILLSQNQCYAYLDLARS